MEFETEESLARLAGFEPAAYGLEVRCSIQLSYRRNYIDKTIPRYTCKAREGHYYSGQSINPQSNFVSLVDRERSETSKALCRQFWALVPHALIDVFEKFWPEICIYLRQKEPQEIHDPIN